MNEKPYEGGCLCGAVRYRATATPVRGVLCHCPQCKKHSGSLALGFVHFPVKSFEWTRGAPARYRSSNSAERGFCARCGSTLGMFEEILAERVQIAIGSLDEPARARIDDHVWNKDRIPWFDVADGRPRFETNSAAVKTRAFD